MTVEEPGTGEERVSALSDEQLQEVQRVLGMRPQTAVRSALEKMDVAALEQLQASVESYRDELQKQVDEENARRETADDDFGTELQALKDAAAESRAEYKRIQEEMPGLEERVSELRGAVDTEKREGLLSAGRERLGNDPAPVERLLGTLETYVANAPEAEAGEVPKAVEAVRRYLRIFFGVCGAQHAEGDEETQEDPVLHTLDALLELAQWNQNEALIVRAQKQVRAARDASAAPAAE